ncbi:hypothetical protein NU219Hw_g6324t1 [Hortaea werneckii]
MMGDLLKTAKYLKSRADYLLARDDTKGAKCSYTAFLQGFNRSIKPLRSSIEAELLYQDLTCAEYIHRIVELALNVQMTTLNGGLLTNSKYAALNILSDLFTDRHVEFPDPILKRRLPRIYYEIMHTMANTLHLHTLLSYPRFVGLHEIAGITERCLKVNPNDERLSHDLNLAKELQARAHDGSDDTASEVQLQEEFEFSSSLAVFPCRMFTCASDNYVVPQSFEMEGWEPGNGPYRLTPTEQRAVYDLQDERGWPRSGFD